MNVVRQLKVNASDTDSILFGEATTPEEIDAVHALRYQVYSRKKYIQPHLYPDQREIDDIDRAKQSTHFIAKLGDTVIGSIRLIITDPLPTERYFSFQEAREIQHIPRHRRGELGRLIVIPPDPLRKTFLPRRLVTLFLIDTLSEYGMRNNIDGGYAFLKKSLHEKLSALRMPIHTIPEYTQHIPEDDVLHPYFHQENDPVIPIAFITAEFKEFSDRHIREGSLFSKKDPEHYTLRGNFYVGFLKMLNII